MIEHRREAIEAGEGIDWATAEHLAFGTLLDEGFPGAAVRPGQRARHLRAAPLRPRRSDHRRALHAAEQHLRPGQAHFEGIDSALSEEAVLGFEYGYSLADPNTLTLWEAQFGDFANGAQVVIDQFISSGERKWLRMSGLVMLLPHGYEGQGPEHSSARLERYLQLCAEDNLQVANCSTPANYFHVLRRQMHRRVPQAADRDDAQVAAAAQEGGLEPGRHGRGLVLPPRAVGRRRAQSRPDDHQAEARRPDPPGDPLLRQGLLRPPGRAREERGADDVYILRLEQFYPWPMQSLMTELARFPKAELVWCQEEPKNMGGWTFVDPWLELTLGQL